MSWKQFAYEIANNVGNYFGRGSWLVGYYRNESPVAAC
jgi:hypothetical protein